MVIPENVDEVLALSDAALEDMKAQCEAEQRKWTAKVRTIALILDQRQAVREAQKKVAAMSPTDRSALANALAAAGPQEIHVSTLRAPSALPPVAQGE